MTPKRIEITKCLFPITGKNYLRVPQPIIEGMQCITRSEVEIDGKNFDQFEFIPENLSLCTGGNAKREGNYIHIY
jgi:hypothetical protein